MSVKRLVINLLKAGWIMTSSLMSNSLPESYLFSTKHMQLHSKRYNNNTKIYFFYRGKPLDFNASSLVVEGLPLAQIGLCTELAEIIQIRLRFVFSLSTKLKEH